MKLNLGCGSDIRDGYINVDFRFNNERSNIRNVNLSKIPWPWEDSSVEQVLMLDILEHFPYSKTDQILFEVWRILEADGELIVQVPDFEHCARAAIMETPFGCNVCGYRFDKLPSSTNKCYSCETSLEDISEAAIKRLYGGQDYEGNWHFNAFTKAMLKRKLSQNGFGEFKEFDINQNGETYYENWNIRFSAKKLINLW